MTLQIRDIETETTEGPVRFHDWIDYRGLTSDQRQRVTQHVIRHAQAACAQASHDLGGANMRTLQAAGGGAAIIRALAAIRELHALDDRMLRDIGLSRSEIEWVVVHGIPNRA